MNKNREVETCVCDFLPGWLAGWLVACIATVLSSLTGESRDLTADSRFTMSTSQMRK